MKAGLGRPVRLAVSSTTAHLALVRCITERMCELMGFDEEATTAVVLSVDEAMTNIIRHAYRGADDQPIEVEWVPVGESRPEALRIRLRDHGRWVDPSRIKPRDLDDVRPGGLGVHIMTQSMDNLEYRRAEGGGTVLTMVKRCGAAGGGKNG
jgi:anti-sigma regulatory factor (Ser/Thr protein kinase)